MKQFYLAGILLFALCFPSFAQINFNANSTVPPYNINFLFGSNGGYYPTWNIYAMADIEAGNPDRNIPGVGIKSLHNPLPEQFLSDWGYDIYKDVFPYFNRLGLVNNTIWLETPTAEHKDNTIYPGCTDPSDLWSNLYTPIWDGGANGTPVNDTNYLALYVYNTVTRYKQWVKVWEIVNEPDFDYGQNGWRSPGDPGNWWDNNPSPCELANLHAPVFNYIRALRIVYEVVKSIDPTAFVSMGGVGYPAFLDVVLRNTDNPADGKVSGDYPNTGGAYFDCVSFHYYPMYDLRYFDSNGVLQYTRHSDAAIDQYISRKNKLASTLSNYGYNDTTYPKKIFICTENNISRKPFDWYVGGDEVQRNYDMKAIVASQLNDIRQLYLFSVGDNEDYATATEPFDLVGFYQNLNGNGPGEYAYDTLGPYLQQYNNSGIACKTFSDALSGFSPDLQQTNALNLPPGVRGGAFRNAMGDYRYVLWAATTTDNSEDASASYSFPPSINMPAQVYQAAWDYFQTQSAPLVSSQNIALTGAPTIIYAPLVLAALRTDSVRAVASYFSATAYPNPVQNRFVLKLHLQKREQVSILITDAMGRPVLQPAGSKLYEAGNNLIYITLPPGIQAGMYYCRLIAGTRDQTIKLAVTK